MKRLLIFACVASCAVLSSCISIPERGDEGQACFKDGTCLPGFVCNGQRVCEKPGEAGDSGGGDTSADSGADASHPSDASDDAADAGFDAGDDTGAPDTGASDAGGDAATPDSGEDAGTDAGCVPDCSGKNCDDDGCQGSCGTCNNPPASVCQDANTIREYSPAGTCNAFKCDYQHSDRACPNGCANGKCQNCTPDCAAKDCGLDGCGGSCGNCTTCKNVCDVSVCKATTHASSACSAGDLYWFDSCSVKEDLKQDCTVAQVCYNNVCCTPSCAGKCGGASDGCTGTCPDPCNGHGTCSAGTCTCTTGYQAPSCSSCVAGYSGYPNCTQSAGCGPSPSGKGGDMCDVAAGAYMMGCNTTVDKECYGDGREDPYHSVTVPAFKIDKYEVTASEYLACVTASGCTAANTGSGCNYNVSGKESHPINCVDWDQAKAYCTWAGKKLPTEAEWEKAARGTDGRKYPWGNEVLDCNRAVHSVSPCSNSGTATVGSKPTGASPYGAMDMVGNVWEWVEDDYHSSYTGAPANGSAWIDGPRGTYRVLRGGGWNYSNTLFLRASNRYNNYPTLRDYNNGFRCSRDGI